MRQASKRNNNTAIGRIVIVSNRLPVALTRVGLEQWQFQLSPGGLVTALNPILRERGGLWIGWPGTLEEVDFNELLAVASRDSGYILEPVSLTEEEIKQYYFGFSNEIIWPLFHDLQTRCNFAPAYWHAYQAVNRKFAEVIGERV